MEDHSHHHMSEYTAPQTSWFVTYRPLLFVLAGILIATGVTAWVRGDFTGAELMRLFMGYFFVVFAFFKLLDLKGFASAYAEYDIVAARSRAYAFAYPFIEAGLGLGYLFAWQLKAITIATLIVMLVSSVGVLKALLGEQKIRCACLGVFVKLPMTTITLIEDLGMAGMAAIMLFYL